MTVHVFHLGANRQMKAGGVFASGANRPIQRVYVFKDGSNRLVFSALSVAVANVSGHAEGFASSGFVISEAANPVITGGSGSYTYQWTHVSTSQGPTPSCSVPTGLKPQWSATVSGLTPSVSTWKLTVTDTVYGVTAEDTCTVTLTWTNLN